MDFKCRNFAIFGENIIGSYSSPPLVVKRRLDGIKMGDNRENLGLGWVGYFACINGLVIPNRNFEVPEKAGGVAAFEEDPTENLAGNVVI